MARPRVLLTGFGPYPGVAENPSGWLAETLAARGPLHNCDLHAFVLPAEWKAIATRTPRLYDALQPHVMIHFGVAPRTRALRIERSAHNLTASRTDACGVRPGANAIAPEGALRLDTGLPVARLAAHLRTQGIAARTSQSCGRYLCNFLYYRSLQWARSHARDALFVHVPRPISQGGPIGQGAPIDKDALLHAAEETLRFVLDVTMERQQTRPARAQGAIASPEGELRP